MKKSSIFLLITLVLATTLLSGCAKKDLIIDYGKGDSIRLVGGADNFDCDDPAYANVKKNRTWTMQFADGSTKFLCTPEGAVTKTISEPEISGTTVLIDSTVRSSRIGSERDQVIEELGQTRKAIEQKK